MYEEDFFSSPTISAFDPLTHLQSLHFDLSILRDRVHQAATEPLLVSSNQPEIINPHANALIQSMIAAASSILLSLHQLSAPQTHENQPRHDVVEIDAVALLAKYTHHCQVCGKGFRRDANLRMHMRAHGDAYKTRAALARGGGAGASEGNRYSCPQEGCRWNWKHAKFQPLKSVACAKNHYRRSHCPKLYVCSRCGNKEFSVLSDLRTHEKHCGKARWRCECGTTFSRKDKLLGHVGLFVGHAPAPEGAVVGVAEMEGMRWK